MNWYDGIVIDRLWVRQLSRGRHMVQKYPDVPMPGMMIPVSVSGLLMSEEAKERMREIEPRDPILFADMFDTMLKSLTISSHTMRHFHKGVEMGLPSLK